MRFLRSLVIALPLIVSSAAGVRPQESPGGREGIDDRSGSIDQIDFPGGSLESYVGMLRERSKEVNVVLSPGAAQIQVPALTLKKVSIRTALEVLSFVTREGERSVKVARLADQGREFYVLSAVGKEPEKKELQVFSIKSPQNAKGLPQAQARLEAVLQAVDSALGIQGDQPGEKPMIKLHPDSGLLLVQGSRSQVAAVAQVMEALQRQDSPGQADQELYAQVKALQDQVDRLRAEIDELKKARQNGGR